jgi:hypothetical protein
MFYNTNFDQLYNLIFINLIVKKKKFNEVINVISKKYEDKKFSKNKKELICKQNKI